MPRNGFADEIAVLDGLDVGNGRIGRTPATGAEYARRKSHSFETRRNVIDASEGANYSGGSSFPGGLPLLPSSVGLADNDLIDYSRVVNVLPPRKNVIDPSGGALYTGGSSFAPGMPLVVSGDPGLAEVKALIEGGYGRAGLGAAVGPMMGGGYGRAGMGRFDTYQDYEGIGLESLDRAFGSSLEVEDGRIGRTPATGAEYANRVSQNFETRSGVIDASEGANYSGGSSYAPSLPLLPSSVGLAELDAFDELDQWPDVAFARKIAASLRKPFKRYAGIHRLRALKGKALKIKKGYAAMTPQRKMVAKRKLARIGSVLGKVRRIRYGIAKERMKPVGRGKAMLLQARRAGPVGRAMLLRKMRGRGVAAAIAAQVASR